MKTVKNVKKLLSAAILAAAVAFGSPCRPAQAAPETNIYVIDKNGTGNFTTIQEGVDYASDGDTLIIYPGVYTEEVAVMDKELNIVGVSRDLCVLQYDTSSYMHMPLTIGTGKVSNLTIYGMSAQKRKVSASTGRMPEIVPLEWQTKYPGYAVHVDQNALYGRRLSFENCRIVSENNNCVGIGGRGNSSITFEGCELVSLDGGGCLYMHDPISLTACGEMALVMKNCLLMSYTCPYVMTFQSYEPGINSLKLTFQNTRVSAVAFENSQCYIPVNANSFHDVESLMLLEDMGALGMAGLKSTAAELVHDLTIEESSAYMKKLRELLSEGDVLNLPKGMLPEGITYMRSPLANSWPTTRHQTIAIYNRSNAPGNGWCGLDSAYLTPDSFGNTLPEMNASAAANGLTAPVF